MSSSTGTPESAANRNADNPNGKEAVWVDATSSVQRPSGRRRTRDKGSSPYDQEAGGTDASTPLLISIGAVGNCCFVCIPARSTACVDFFWCAARAQYGCFEYDHLYKEHKLTHSPSGVAYCTLSSRLFTMLSASSSQAKQRVGISLASAFGSLADG